MVTVNERSVNQRSADFFRRLRDGVSVVIAVAGPAPDKVFGVRDGFQRFFRHSLGEAPAVSIRQIQVEDGVLAMTVEETLIQARDRAAAAERSAAAEEEIPGAFAVGSESGLMVARAGGETRYLVDHWTVVRAFDEETWGSSGGVQIPQSLVAAKDGELAPAEVATLGIPGTRRSGGMAASLTSGGVTRRTAAAQSTFQALCSLFYGRLGVQHRA